MNSRHASRFDLTRRWWIAASSAGVLVATGVFMLVSGWHAVVTDPITWILAAALIGAAAADHRHFTRGQR
jgi:hypothetical protein